MERGPRGLTGRIGQAAKWWLPWCVVFLAAEEAVAASALRGFPVRLKGTVDIGAPVAFDIDDDGQLELLVCTTKELHALEMDGSRVAGFPVELKKGAQIATALTIGRLAPEGKPAILFGTQNNQLVALDGSGKLLSGFPLSLGAVLAGPPTLADLNGNGRVKIIFATKDGRVYAVDVTGRGVSGYPASVGASVSTAITAGRFQPRGKTVLFFGDERGNLHAWEAPGKELEGFPFKSQYTISSQPTLGDIDDDGSFEVIFGSKDFKIYAVKQDGSLAAGFPVATEYRIYSTCAIADIDDDGVNDIIATSGDGKLYALTKGGRALKGFPTRVGSRLRGSPAVGDVDCDGHAEIAVGSDRNQIALLRHNGRVYPGFPIGMEDRVDMSPLIADLNGDGLVEVIAVSRNGTVAVLRIIKKGKVTKGLSWPTEGRDPARRGMTYPNPPRYVDLKIHPELPVTTQALSLSYRFFDLDGDPEPQTKILWYRNGKPVLGFEGARTIPASASSKNERWHFTLRADPYPQVFESPAVTVQNTAPGAPQVVIVPDPARTGDDLQMKIVRESEDLDGDPIQYNISWIKDRMLVKDFHRPTVPAKRTACGQRWTAVLTPSDGEVNGPPARASIVIQNTVPSAAKVRLEPARPTVTQEVRVMIERPAQDPDGDNISYRYLWMVGKQPLNLPTDFGVMPAGFVAKHGKIQTEVTSFDGKEEGGKSQATAEVINTPAAAPLIRIVPSSPRTGDDLTVEVDKPALDPDKDAIDYTAWWKRQGDPYQGPHAQKFRLPATETRKKEKWSVMVTPLDGESQGEPARAEVTIGNTPPGPPVAEPTNPRPMTTEDLVVHMVQKPVDPDGDTVAVEVVWYEGVREITRGVDLLRLPASQTRKQVSYLAKLIPSDGESTGQELQVWFEVQNSPPTQCQVFIKPSNPGSGDSLVAQVAKPPSDPDGDRVQLRYRWYRGGEPIETGSRPEQVDGNQVSRGQRWTVVATPFDGEATGPNCDASVVVVNRPPIAPQIVLEPQQPTALDSLICKVVGKSIDPDGDQVKLLYSWTVGGKHYPAADGSQSIPAGVLVKGQQWRVSVTASDGELSSQPVPSVVTVANSPPDAPRVEIRPEKPLSTDDLQCRLMAPTTDPDGDEVHHTYEWFLVKGRKGQQTGKPAYVGPVLPAERTRKMQHWVCKVTAQDGMLAGKPKMARVQVANAAPTAPQVEIQPNDPMTNQAFRCAIVREAQDPDQDRIKYRFQWTKDGVVQPFASETDGVPARLTKEKDIWQCGAVATDGNLESPLAESQEVIVRPP